MNFKKILIIQTAFIGDVILATPIIEKIHQYYPDASIDFLVRKGNESLLVNHPYINRLLLWDKKKAKYGGLYKILNVIRRERYDLLINLQRFASTGMITALSNARHRIGFDKNPFSFLFDKKVNHDIGNGKHEVERNIQLISGFTDDLFTKPKLYPSKEDYAMVRKYKEASYICIAPTSVWFTKQFPLEKWISFINKTSFKGYIYLLGAPTDQESCDAIVKASLQPNVVNLAGKLSLLQSAALMEDAILNYVNDSAPMHLASSVNAKTCAVFCSTSPQFGFYPLADFSKIVEIQAPLPCKPCGLHGYKACPLHHFDCAFKIKESQLLEALDMALEDEGFPGKESP